MTSCYGYSNWQSTQGSWNYGGYQQRPQQKQQQKQQGWSLKPNQQQQQPSNHHHQQQSQANCNMDRSRSRRRGQNQNQNVQAQKNATAVVVQSNRQPVPACAPLSSPGDREELYAFFRGKGTDCECRSLNEILAWDDTLMEVCHDYIQWVFPTDELSKFNSDAPVLDREAQKVFASDPVIRDNLRRVLQRFVKFLGLKDNFDTRQEGEPMKIEKADNFEKRILMCWQGPANHNWKRNCRALRCLGLSDMIDEQQALLSCLEGIIVSHPGLIDDASVGRWLDEGCVKSKLVQTVSTGYITGVLRSPNLLASLCNQYFHRYDLNSDGFLCLHEVDCLARELHASLGLPLDTINEKNLMESISGFDENHRLTKESFPRWFRKELEHTIEKSERLKVVAENEPGMRRRSSSKQFGSFSGDIREQRPDEATPAASSPAQAPAEAPPVPASALLPGAGLLGSPRPAPSEPVAIPREPVALVHFTVPQPPMMQPQPQTQTQFQVQAQAQAQAQHFQSGLELEPALSTPRQPRRASFSLQKECLTCTKDLDPLLLNPEREAARCACLLETAVLAA